MSAVHGLSNTRARIEMALIKAESAQGFARLPVVQQIGLMVGLAVCVALGVAVALWSQKPGYSLLYSGLPDKEAAAIVDALQRSGTQYRLDANTGAIMVPAQDVRATRMKLANEGLPKSADTGLEFLESDQELGASQFVQQARYQHALEVELARSIAGLRNVASARVHLAIPKPSVFVRKKDQPTASVILDLHPGRRLDEKEVDAVVHLVASSIANLNPDKVTVVDQNGRLLTQRSDDNGLALTASQFDYTRQVEETYVSRIENLLMPLVGPGGVRAQVKAGIDFTRTEQAQERYAPEIQVLRSEQLYEETRAGADAAGIPGALTNQPPEGGTTDPAAGKNATGKPVEPKARTQQSTRNYELDRTVSHTQSSGGQVTRLSVAVIVDDRQVTAADGNIQRTPLTPEEIATITALVKDAVGFDATRGDTISVSNQAFQSPQVLPLPPPPWWDHAWLQDLVKVGAGGLLILLLVLGVLRPVLNKLAERGPRQPDAIALPNRDGDVGDDQLSLQHANQTQLAAPGQQAPDRLTAARQVVSTDPGRVAQVVRNWVGSDG